MCPVDRVVDRCRTELDCLHQRRRGACRFASVPCPPGMLERVFECGSALAPAASLDRPLAQRACMVIERSELVSIEVRLLEVVALELVLSVVELQPAGETLVEVGPCPLGDPGVGRIPDQGVPEAETVLAGNARPGGLDELPAHESE